MDEFYYESIDKMEKAGVRRDYIVGWASGYLENPRIEQQRVTDSWEAGYSDGKEKNDANFSAWAQQ
ncbi:MAG: hypothetical protein LJE84_14075 [Gammaproteobacteria bacterium]|jgi:hypothetical protein|nr:hypothetical protein [Gammaproteobacteria bacterium]